jgi:hypothetical protein
MPHRIKKQEALQVLHESFPLAEDDHRDGTSIEIPEQVTAATERLFTSKTQAYREVLVSCVIARIIDQEIDIRLPAVAYGEDAYSGRTITEQAVTPFLRERFIPISSNPFLSALRGGAKFMKGGQPRIQRDKEGFESLVDVVDYLRGLGTEDAKKYLRFLLRRFIQLRELGDIPLKKLAKPNLGQLQKLITGLLKEKSGGRIPSLLATALFQTIGECHALGWEVEFQGINVADKASGAVGDITIRKDGAIILGVEVTERPIDQARVTLTFNQKVSPSSLTDYLFITTATPKEEALAIAHSYTGVGHEMNFVLLDPWLIHNLSIVGPACRALFQAKMIALISAQGTSADIRVAWNNKMDEALGVKPAS